MLKIYFDNVLINDDAYAELTNEYKLFNDSFYLGSTASNTFKLKILKSEVSNHPTNVKIEDDNTTFHLIVDKVEEEKGFYNYYLVDKMVDFNFNYDAKPLIDSKLELEEETYLSDILEDMCLKANVELDYTLTNNIIVNWYDNRIQAREYLSFIAELEGGYACIDELGKLTIKQHKQASKKTISADEVSELIIGEKKKITRVVYDNGVVKYEFGDDTGNTLYLNQNNVFITDEVVVENIYNKIVGFEFYTLTVPNALIDSSIKAGDVITFIDDESEYQTIAQYSSSYGGGWVGSYDFNINSEKQQETNVIGFFDSIKSIRTEIDRGNAELQIIAEKTDENESRIGVLEFDTSNFKVTISDEVDDVSSRVGALELTTEQLGLDFQKSGNNLFVGTHFRNLDNWRTSLQRKYIESDMPPIDNTQFNYWYCTQSSGNYEKGQMYEWSNNEWISSLKTRMNLDSIENENIQIGSSSNIKNMTVSGGYLALNLNNNINSVFNLYQEFIPLANTQEKTTTTFGVDVDLEYGMVYFEPRYYTKKVVLNNEEYDFIERSQFVMFSMEKKKGMYKLEMPITSDSKFITFVIRVEPSPITHVAGYPPEEVDKYTLWGEPVMNRIYKPNFDEKGEVISWEDIGIPFTVAELNASNYPKLTNGIPFLFPKGTVNFYDLKAEYGDYTIWSSNPNEVIGTNYILNDKGFFLTSGDSKLTLSADEIISLYRDTKIFEIYNEIVFGKNLKSETLNTNGLITKKIPIGNKTSYIRYIEEVD